jgi:hypothetical protein
MTVPFRGKNGTLPMSVFSLFITGTPGLHQRKMRTKMRTKMITMMIMKKKTTTSSPQSKLQRGVLRRKRGVLQRKRGVLRGKREPPESR